METQSGSVNTESCCWNLKQLDLSFSSRVGTQNIFFIVSVENKNQNFLWPQTSHSNGEQYSENIDIFQKYFSNYRHLMFRKK